MEEDLTLENGHDWADDVLRRMDEADWSTQIDAFENLIHILPQIYETLEIFGYHKLSRKLLKASNRITFYV